MKTWGMPLHQRPVVVVAGIVEHGRNSPPIEHWNLPVTWTLHAYNYDAELILDGEHHRIRPGSVGIIAPGVEQEYRLGGVSRHVFAHIELPAKGALVPVPVMAELGERFASFRTRFEEVAGDVAGQPMRCSIRIWDLLWELADLAAGNAAEPAGDPRMAAAIAIIEQELEQDLSVARIAARIGISHNQLTRLFRAQVDNTVVGYIRQRRVERAVHLLIHTGMAIGAIAAGVGIADPQAFNKTVKALTGKAPSAFRRQGGRAPG